MQRRSPAFSVISDRLGSAGIGSGGQKFGQKFLPEQRTLPLTRVTDAELAQWPPLKRVPHLVAPDLDGRRCVVQARERGTRRNWSRRRRIIMMTQTRTHER